MLVLYLLAPVSPPSHRRPIPPPSHSITSHPVSDIAFVDFLMPVMNGIQMVTRYRKWEKEQEDRGTKQYIVGISANADGSDIEEGKRQGG